MAHAVAPLLTLLVIGNFMNGLSWMPFQAQLAHGWTRLALLLNIFAVFFVVPAVLWMTPRFGAIGAAYVWVVLNTCYLLLGVHLMFRRILVQEQRLWFIEDLLFPILASFAVPLCLKAVWRDELSAGLIITCLLISSIGALFSSLLASSRLRGYLLNRKTLGLLGICQ